MGNAYIGTSGWSYKHWSDGVFYPKGLAPSGWLGYYCGHFDTVEINNSFYRLPSEKAFLNWARQVPSDFIFAVKASRFLTHIRRLREPLEPIELFMSRADHLKPRLGPVLFQLPPQFKIDIDRLRGLLDVLPKASGRRYVLEVRDTSWLDVPVFRLLEKYNIALCFADWREVVIEGPVTGNFVYVRRHAGPEGGNYRYSDLTNDAKRIEEWVKAGLDVYVYFNNDPHGHAVRNALFLKNLLFGKHA